MRDTPTQKSVEITDPMTAAVVLGALSTAGLAENEIARWPVNSQIRLTGPNGKRYVITVSEHTDTET